MKRSTIIGSGSYIPENKVPNADFHKHEFYTPDHTRIDNPGEVIAHKFQEITGIQERRYADANMNASDLGYRAAKRAIEDAGIDPESIDQIICATNFGDVQNGTIQCDFLPAVASRIKHLLKIKNPYCVAYDIIFGCPGWVQGVIQSDSYMRSGDAKTTLVIGAETLSRVIDPHDRDSMIFSDGAGATILRYQENEDNAGILSTAAMSHTTEEAYYLFMGASNLPESDRGVRYIKMHGRKVYEYALTYVPEAMKACLDKAQIDISEVKKIFIHQANEKLDEGVIKRLYRLYGHRDAPEGIMPMSVHLYGNSSVATVPTLFDEVVKGNKEGHTIQKGDVILFASVGAGMNINAVAYRI
jgi:3-oxoacyl-[acyl-carrier-protein] synthase-3